MAGLMEAGAPAPEQQAPAAPQQQEEPNVSPEEQQDYQRFVANGILAIYSDPMHERVLQSLGGNAPAEALASTAATVVKQLESSARGQGKQISPDILLHGGKEIFEELADLQKEAGLGEVPDDQLEGAWYRALELYRGMAEADGSVDPNAVEQDMATLMAADREGQLDQVVPGLSSAAEKGAM